MRHALAVLIVLAAACGGKAAPREATRGDGAEAATSISLLEYIPATTPYVYAQLDPLPEEYVEERLLVQARAAEALLDRIASARQQDPEAFEDLDFATRAMLALAAELRGKMSRRGMAELGLDLRGRFVVYGEGIWPVFRLELADGQKFRATLARMLEHLELDLPILAHGNTELWHGGERLRDAPFDLVVTVAGNQLIAAMTPRGDAQRAFLDTVLADEPRRKSLADSGELAVLAQRYQFTAGAAGYLDWVRAAELGADLFPKAEAACKTELRSLVAATPRWVLGVQEVSSRRVAVRAVLETPADLRDALERARAPVPALTRDVARAHAFAIGVGLDLRAFADYARPRLAALAEHRYRCTALSWVRESASTVEDALTALATSPARSLLGAQLLVKKLELDGGFPTAIDAALFVATRDPSALLASLSALVPDLGKSRLAPGSAPVAIELPGLGFLGPAHLTVGANGVALALGNATDLLSLINRDPAGGMPLFLVHGKGELIRRLERLGNPGEDLDPKLADAIAELDRSDYESFTAEAQVIGDGIRVDIEMSYPSTRVAK